MIIDSAGHVGIGTDSPSSYNSAGDNLVIGDSGNAGMSIVSGPNNAGTIFFARGVSGSETRSGFIEYTHDDDKLKFAAAGNARMYIDANGRVDITGSLYVNGTPKIGTSELIETLAALRRRHERRNH